MADKPTFPKISLKYPNLDAFARAARKSFEKGRLTVKLKRDFENKQKILLIFQLGDRAKPVEIIGQVLDRAPAKGGEGFNYGISFLNFTEKKLNRLLAGEDLKPVQAPKSKPEPAPEIKAQAPEPAPVAPAEPAPITEAKASPPVQPEAAPEPVAATAVQPPEPEPGIQPSVQPASEEEFELPYLFTEQEPAEIQKSAPAVEPGPTPEPSPAPSQEAAPARIQAKSEAAREDYGEFEYVDEEVVIQVGAKQAFDHRPEKPEEPGAEAKPEKEAAGVEKKVEEPEAEPAKRLETKPAVSEAESAEPAKAEVEEEEEVIVAEPGREHFEAKKVAIEPGSEQEPSVASETAATETMAAKAVPAEASEPEAAPEPAMEIDDEEALPEEPLPAQLKPEPEFASAPEEAAFEAPEVVEEPAQVAKPAPAVSRVEARPVPPAPAPAKPAAELKPVPAKALTDFLFRFCKMILNPPDATLPDSAKNFNSLFEDFQKLMEGRDRLGIYLALMQSGKDFIIEGAQTATRSIRVVLPPDLSGTLIFKMIEVFDQKELVGIVFRKFVDLERFKNFILELGKFQPEKENADALALRLIYMGVYHFNLIFETDLVAVPAKIEEETKVILARFSGELKRLKSLANQISEEPLALLTLRLEDIVKFVSNPVVIAQMLEQLPLVWADQVEEFDFDEFEDQILFAIPIPLLLGTFEVFAKKITEVEKSNLKPKQKDAALARVQRVLRRVMARIAYEAPAQALEPLADLFSRNIIKYEELPGEIRNQVAASMLAGNFLREPEQKLGQMDLIKDAKLYSEVADQMIWVAVALLEAENKKWANEIFKKLVAHYQDKTPPFPERPRLAREVLKKLSEPTAIEILVKFMESGKKDDRELAAAMLYAAGESAARRLIALLETSEDRNVRRMICEILFRYGEKVAPILAEELNKPDIPWYLTRNMLMVFSEIKSGLARERAMTLLQHPHQRVREEALGYLFAIGENGIEQLLTDSFKDPESSVRRRALSCLAKMESISEQGLNRIYHLARETAGSALDPDKEIYFQQAIELLARSKMEKTADGTELNEFFLELLQMAEKGLFSRAKFELTAKMKVALIDALGRRKVEDARKILSKMTKAKDELVRKSAQKWLEQIG